MIQDYQAWTTNRDASLPPHHLRGRRTSPTLRKAPPLSTIIRVTAPPLKFPLSPGSPGERVGVRACPKPLFTLEYP